MVAQTLTSKERWQWWAGSGPSVPDSPFLIAVIVISIVILIKMVALAMSQNECNGNFKYRVYRSLYYISVLLLPFSCFGSAVPCGIMEGSYHPERNAPLFPLLMWATHDKIVSLPPESVLPSRSQAYFLKQKVCSMRVSVFRSLSCIYTFSFVTPNNPVEVTELYVPHACEMSLRCQGQSSLNLCLLSQSNYH